MFTSWDKALVALVMATAYLITYFTDFDLGWLTTDKIEAIIAVVTPFLVWWVPNKGFTYEETQR